MQSRGLAEGEDPRSIGPLYLVTFVYTLTAFRLPEFQAAADYLDVRYCFVPVPRANETFAAAAAQPSTSRAATPVGQANAFDVSRAFALVHLADDDVARKITARVTAIRGMWQHWVSAPTLDEARTQLRDDPLLRAIWLPWRKEDISWRATVVGHMRMIPEAEKRNRIEAFADVLDFPGPVRLRDPQLDWCFAEEWSTAVRIGEKDDADGGEFTTLRKGNGAALPQRQQLLAVHIGRNLIGSDDAMARSLINKLDVKKRVYIGNTTMESGMSLVQAVMARAGPGKFVYDPFAGTGSLLLAAAVLGAHVFGSDIDARMIRGKIAKDGTIGPVQSARQYGVESLLIDAVTFDITQNPLHRGGLFDAIVTDPPYGVRAGAKRLGRRDATKTRLEPYQYEDGSYPHQLPDYMPPNKPYPLDDVLADLMTFAAHMLVPRGRLVFWMPTMTEVDGKPTGEDEAQYATTLMELQLPSTRDFRLVAHSLQDFGNWGRRLITLEKIERDESIADVDLRLPSAPENHAQRTNNDTSLNENEQKPSKGAVRATDNPNEFRNQFFASYSKNKRQPVE